MRPIGAAHRREPVAEELESGHRAALAVDAGAHDEVGPAGAHGADDELQVGRAVGAVAVEEDRDAVGCGRHAGQAGSAVAAPRLVHDVGARRPRHLGGPVAGAVVHNDDAGAGGVQDRAQGFDDGADGGLLVEAGDDHLEGSGEIAAAHLSNETGGLLRLGD